MNWFAGRGSSESVNSSPTNEHQQTRGLRDSLQNQEDGGPGIMLPDSSRDGKFSDISEFMDVPRGERALMAGYKRIGHMLVDPGLIFHVCDPKSRLDQRVMLVLRKSTMSFQCLTFCKHWRPPKSKDHWRVCSEGQTQNAVDNEGLHPLEVILRPYGRTEQQNHSPTPNLTINIQDFWNVEDEVYVKPLGEVTPTCLRQLAQAVIELFSESLYAVVPPIAASPPAAEPARQAMQPAQREGPRQVRDEPKRKGCFVRHTSKRRKEKR